MSEDLAYFTNVVGKGNMSGCGVIGVIYLQKSSQMNLMLKKFYGQLI